MPDIFDTLAASDLARVQELEGLILKAREAYYNNRNVSETGQQVVSDETYDAWVDELAELQATSPAVTSIGSKPTSEWKKAKHDIQMGSLDKVNTLDELTKWFLSVHKGNRAEPVIVTEKLDGISIHIRYRKGAFEQAITLGDGITGEDISVNVCKMQGVLARLPEKFTGSLRGEIILTKEAHTTHFPDYANTRNAASGIAKRYDGKGCEHLSVLFYQVAEGMEFENESQQFEWLTEMGFKTPNWYVTAMVPGVKTPHDLWLEYQQTKRAELPYDIDGLVVRLQNLEKQFALGETNGRPEGARAFKFQNITRETVLQKIEWQVGGSGVITPVACFDPVRLLGAEVTNATLHNIKYIQDLGLSPGARIIIARANDVIPRVVSVSFPSPNPFVVPTACPSCGGKVEMNGAHLICPNITTCPAQAVGRIKRYVKELEILEWGETLIEKLVEKGLVKSVPDLYKLTLADLAGIERMGEKSAENVLKTLWAKTPIPLENLLGALSIPMCSTTTIRACVDKGLDTWEKFAAAKEADFQSVPGVGIVKGAMLEAWVSTIGKNVIMPALFAAGVQVKGRTQGVLTGQSFCFTGKSTRKRSELESLVTDNGGVVKASVTKGLNYLVMADPQSASTKAQAARKNGTVLLSEEDFLKMAMP